MITRLAFEDVSFEYDSSENIAAPRAQLCDSSYPEVSEPTDEDLAHNLHELISKGQAAPADAEKLACHPGCREAQIQCSCPTSQGRSRGPQRGQGVETTITPQRGQVWTPRVHHGKGHEFHLPTYLPSYLSYLATYLVTLAMTAIDKKTPLASKNGRISQLRRAVDRCPTLQWELALRGGRDDNPWKLPAVRYQQLRLAALSSKRCIPERPAPATKRHCQPHILEAYEKLLGRRRPKPPAEPPPQSPQPLGKEQRPHLPQQPPLPHSFNPHTSPWMKHITQQTQAKARNFDKGGTWVVPHAHRPPATAHDMQGHPPPTIEIPLTHQQTSSTTGRPPIQGAKHDQRNSSCPTARQAPISQQQARACHSTPPTPRGHYHITPPPPPPPRVKEEYPSLFLLSR